MKIHETTHLVEQKDLNHHGTLFAAVMASWFVEMGFIAAAYEYKNTKELVCIGMDEVRFTHPVSPGTLLKMRGKLIKAGTTSLTIQVTAEDALNNTELLSGNITFVVIDENTRKKKPHGLTLTGNP